MFPSIMTVVAVAPCRRRFGLESVRRAVVERLGELSPGRFHPDRRSPRDPNLGAAMTWTPPPDPKGGWPEPPRCVAHLVQILGIPAAYALVEARGGTRPYIPKTPTPELERLVGPEGAYELAAVHGGNYLKVPLARNWRILVRRACGASYAEIATALVCTTDTVWRVLSQSPGWIGNHRQDERRGETVP